MTSESPVCSSPPPRVTIGLPVFNGGHALEAAIRSVLMQSFTDFRLVIHDNCSSDATETLCRRFVLEDPRVTYLRHAQNIGAFANFASLLTVADSEFFMFMAHDDSLGKDFLSQSVAELVNDNSIVASTAAPFSRPNCESILFGYVGFEEESQEDRIDSFVTLLPDGNARFYSLYRASVIKSIKFDRANCFAGDWIIITEILKSGKIRVNYGRDIAYIKTRSADNETRRQSERLSLVGVICSNPFRNFVENLPPAVRASRRQKLAYMHLRFVLRLAAHKFASRRTQLRALWGGR